MSVFFCGLEFARRGYNTLCLDGPGMGEMRRMRDMPSRYDYEVPGGAALDYLLTRPESTARTRHRHDGDTAAAADYCRASPPLKNVAPASRSALHWDIAALTTEDIKDATATRPARWPVEIAVALGRRRQRRRQRHRDHTKIIKSRHSKKNISCALPGSNPRRQRRVVLVENAQKLFERGRFENKTIKIFTAGERRRRAPMSTTAGSASISPPIGWRTICD